MKDDYQWAVLGRRCLKGSVTENVATGGGRLREVRWYGDDGCREDVRVTPSLLLPLH